MSHLKSIAFESAEVHLANLRERLRKMSDEELIKYGKMVRSLCAPRVCVTPDPWKVQLEEARAEWRKRHPKNTQRIQGRPTSHHFDGWL